MNLKSIFNKGKKIVDERGGVDSLKEDAQELAGIARGKGSVSDKAKQAAAAIKDPGSNRAENERAAQGRHPNRQATEDRRADADRQESKERRRP